jgi:hypothetical protein
MSCMNCVRHAILLPAAHRTAATAILSRRAAGARRARSSAPSALRTDRRPLTARHLRVAGRRNSISLR